MSNIFENKGALAATIVVAASNSLNFGAANYVCDGTADEVEIQAAIDALPATGGCVILLDGLFNTTATINLASNVKLVGAGRDATIIRGTGADVHYNILRVDAVSNVTIEDMTLDGNWTAGVSAGGEEASAFRIFQSSYVSVNRVNVTEGNTHCMSIGQSTHVAIDTMVASNPFSDDVVSICDKPSVDPVSEHITLKSVEAANGIDACFEIDDGPHHVSLVDCVAHGSSEGFSVETSEDLPPPKHIKFERCRAYDVVGIGFKAKNYADPLGDIEDVYYFQCHVPKPSDVYVGIEIGGVNGVKITECYFETGARCIIGPDNTNTSFSRNVTVSKNTFFGNNENRGGINVVAASGNIKILDNDLPDYCQIYVASNLVNMKGVTITGNKGRNDNLPWIYVIATYATYDLSDLVISNNIQDVEAGTQAGDVGIKVHAEDADIADVVIEGNICLSGLHGIHVVADGGRTITNIAITSNRCHSATSYCVNIVATGTITGSIVGNNVTRAGGTAIGLGITYDGLIHIKDNIGTRMATAVRDLILARNVSGGNLVTGDVVILDPASGSYHFTTTVVLGDDRVWGMLLQNIDNNALGFVLVEGYTQKLKVNGTIDIAIGDFLCTHTVAGIAQKAAAGDMAFAIAYEAYAGDDSNGVIDAILIKPRKI